MGEVASASVAMGVLHVGGTKVLCIHEFNVAAFLQELSEPVGEAASANVATGV